MTHSPADMLHGFTPGARTVRRLIREQKNNIIMSEINIYRAIEDS